MTFDVDAVAARHTPNYDEDSNPYCPMCWGEQEWPCDAAQAAGAIRELRQALVYCAQPTGWDQNAVEALRVSMYTAKKALERADLEARQP